MQSELSWIRNENRGAWRKEGGEGGERKEPDRKKHTVKCKLSAVTANLIANACAKCCA